MSTPSSAQIEQLKRAAKKLARASSLTHAEALDRLAMENGFKNWSLLAKHGNRSAAVPRIGATLRTAATQSKSIRYYLHGDQVENDPAKFYCAECDFFVDAGHFFSSHPSAETLERCLDAVLRWERRPRAETAYRRQTGAPNLLERQARAAFAAREAARGPFHRWLEQQKGKDSVVGDFANDATTDKKFPVGVTTYEQVHDYLERYASSAALKASKDAWQEFQESVKRE